MMGPERLGNLFKINGVWQRFTIRYTKHLCDVCNLIPGKSLTFIRKHIPRKSISKCCGKLLMQNIYGIWRGIRRHE